MTVQMVLNNRCDRRVMSELTLDILGHNAMGLQRSPEVIRRYFLFHPALEVDEAGETSVEGSVLDFRRTIMQTKERASVPLVLFSLLVELS
jgi:hypothetical protein